MTENSECTLRAEHNETSLHGRSSKLLSFPRTPINIRWCVVPLGDSVRLVGLHPVQTVLFVVCFWFCQSNRQK